MIGWRPNLAQYRQTYANLLQSYEQVRLAEAQSTSNVIQAEPATASERAVRPRTMTNTLLALVVGLLFSTGLVFLIEAMDDTLKGPDQVTEQLGLPVLGLIVRHNTTEGRPVTLGEPRSQVAEAFRSLRTNIQFASVDQPLRTLLITSPTPSEGKSTVAVNLGVVIAQGGKRVALIDADLRRPNVHKLLDLSNVQGLSDLFVQEHVSLDGTLQKTKTADLFVMTSGALPPNPAELLGSEKMYEIIRQVKEQTDLLVIDSPPVIAVTDFSSAGAARGWGAAGIQAGCNAPGCGAPGCGAAPAPGCELAGGGAERGGPQGFALLLLSLQELPDF